MRFDLIKTVQCCDAVPFCIGRIVKNLIDEIVHLGIKGHGHLANMNHLSGTSADDVNS